ncbi:guanine-1-methyltransferase-domain-containing protein [Xylaria flabelliformis]|nr:guanine-1-methyltransferase-domain-containing protein [Xylaria flabelliformis]
MELSEAIQLESTAAETPIIDDNVESNHHTDTGDSPNGRRGVKRPAEDDLSGDDEYDHRDTDPAQPVNTSGEVTSMSKSQLKKLRRREKWEESKQDRRLKRRDKRHERQARRRAERDEECAAAAAEGREPILTTDRQRHRSQTGTRVPVAIIIDCQFEKYMHEAELISLSSQVTRCYADNRGARYPVHLYISSYSGFIKERNETVLENQHLKWKGIRLCEGEFTEVANEAKESMTGPNAGEMIDLLQQGSSGESISCASSAPANTNRAKSAPTPSPEAEDVDKSIVYLTADSPYTLSRLEPNTCYVIGGIIDKNREKGLCYQIARGKNVRTAKLPISEYMILQHRHVLATNHVLEIMLKWLETGDWGTAFLSVIPTRKGGKLKMNEGTPIESVEKETEKRPGDTTVEDDVQEVDKPLSAAQDVPMTENVNNVTEVEGDNAEEGLTRNALDEPRWSAPPLELEKVKSVDDKPTDGI